MFRKFINYQVFFVIVISIISLILYGSILRHHYKNGKRFETLQKIAVFIAEIPATSKKIITERTFNLNKPPLLKKHINKKKFERFLEKDRYGLLILPRYENHLSRSVVDVVDLSNFETIHTYKHDINEVLSKIQNYKIFPKDHHRMAPERFYYGHPILLEDGSLISYGPLFKINFCSKLEWINDIQQFHHSIELDHENNIWIGGNQIPETQYVKKYKLKKFNDDSIVKLNSDGKILYEKSVLEILIDNKILPDNYALSSDLVERKSRITDPVHLNDIEPAFYDTDYWKKGDLFLSSRALNSIIHYRPSNNKVINYITGPFAQQHDPDIISPKEISIFNNNNFSENNKYSEILIYNFETKKFKKMFNDKLIKDNFKTITQGVSHILSDGSLIVEEQNHGRLILYNNIGEKEWEYINQDINGDISEITWSRIIENEKFVEKFKSLVKNKKCEN